MSKDDHFILAFYDEKNRLLDFERFKLKTAENSYKSLLKFIKKYGIKNYERGFNSGLGKAKKLVVSFQEYEPEKEKIIFEKSYPDFLEDLNNM